MGKNEKNQGLSALVAGFGLLVMAVTAPVAHFGLLAGLEVPGQFPASVGRLWTAVALLALTALLDGLVAWALYFFLREVHRGLAWVSAVLRSLYAGGFLLALVPLVQLALGDGPAPVRLADFHQLWFLVLNLFALHLLLVGLLTVRSPRLPFAVGILVILAGAGYLADGIGRLAVPGYALNLAGYTFVGEVALMGALIWRGIRELRKA